MSDERRAPVTQKGQGDSGDGEKTDCHSNIKNYIKRDGADKTQGQKKPKTVRGSKCDVQTFQDDIKKQGQKNNHS